MSIIETKRLCLRELTPDDIDALHEVLSDPIAMKHYPKPFDREMTRKWIEWNLSNYARHAFGLWAVICKADGRLLGDCGLTIQQVDETPELEIGYHILRSRWGEGLATESAIACRDYAFDELGRSRIISWMTPDNAASRRVAEKVGMGLEKESRNRIGTASVVYSMTPDDR
jgi:[ribosomal protein S5]-alanine N-acetyltransferase